MIKHFILLLAEIAGLAFIFSACKARGNMEPSVKLSESLPVIRLFSKDTSLQQAYVADIQACQNVEIRAKVPGFIDKISIDEGQQVKKGQLLFKINDDEYQTQLSHAMAALSSAEAEAKTAELELDRTKILVAKNIVTKSEYALAASKLQFAQARIMEAKSTEANAKLKIAYTSIRAPFDGIVDRIPFKVGSLVTEGNLLTTVSNLQTVYAYFNVSENEYLRYKKAKKLNQPRMDDVQLILADGSSYSSRGKVEAMESVFSDNTGSIAFRATFANPDALLKHGATGKIKLSTKVDDILIIPQKAVLEIQDKNYVFLLRKDSTILMHNFVPGPKMNEFIVVQSGLSAGDAIVYEGIQHLHDGMHINPQFINTDSLIAMNSGAGRLQLFIKKL